MYFFTCKVLFSVPIKQAIINTCSPAQLHATILTSIFSVLYDTSLPPNVQTVSGLAFRKQRGYDISTQNNMKSS